MGLSLFRGAHWQSGASRLSFYVADGCEIWSSGVRSLKSFANTSLVVAKKFEIPRVTATSAGRWAELEVVTGGDLKLVYTEWPAFAILFRETIHWKNRLLFHFIVSFIFRLVM